MSRSQQKYKPQWEKELDSNNENVGKLCSACTNDSFAAWCSICSVQINVGGAGKKQLMRHSSSKKHLDKRKEQNTQPKADSFLTKKCDFDDQVLKSEIKWALFAAEHNLSASLSDDIAEHYKASFPDSKIAGDFCSGRTKTSYLLTDGIRPAFHGKLVRILQTTKFSLMIDESNKTYNTKYLHILIRFYSTELNKTITSFFKAVVVNKGNAENIVSVLDAALVEDLIPWSNVLQVMSDSPNVMRGNKGGVIALIKQRYCPHLIDIGGCSLHHISNAINYATESLGVEITEFVLDIHGFFKYRSGLWEDYEHVQSFLDVPEHNILRVVETRWLYILPVANRILEQWIALTKFFSDLQINQPNIAKQDRVRRIVKHLRDPILHAKLSFLTETLPICDRFEKLFQKENPQIHLLYDEIVELMKSIMSQFVQPKLLEFIQKGANLVDVPFAELKNQLTDSSLSVGKCTQDLVKKMKDNERKLFYLGVRSFYNVATSKLIKYLPLENQLHCDVQFVHPNSQKNASSLHSLRRVSHAFAKIDSSLNTTKIEAEWHSYAVENVSSISTTSDITQYWYAVENLSFPSGDKKFTHLCSLVRLVMTRSHGNADTERSFSESSLILTKQRNRIRLDMLNSLLIVKSELNVRKCKAHNYPISDELLKYAKTARQRHMQKKEIAKEKEEAVRKKNEKERQKRQLEKKAAEKFQQKLDKELQKSKVSDKEAAIRAGKRKSKALVSEAKTLMRECNKKMNEVQRINRKAEQNQRELTKEKNKVYEREIRKMCKNQAKISFEVTKSKSEITPQHETASARKSNKYTEKTQSKLSFAIKANSKNQTQASAVTQKRKHENKPEAQLPFEKKKQDNRDEIACTLIPAKYRHMVALRCEADGNCLFNAISMLIQGDSSLANEIRNLAAEELINNADKYATHSHIINKAAETDTDVETVFQTLLDSQSITLENRASKIKEEGFNSKENGKWCSLLHVMAVSSVIGVTIHSVFQEKEHYAYSLYTGAIRPVSSKGLEQRSRIKYKKDDFVHEELTIMWSRLSIDSSSTIFIPDHVVPLVPK